MIKIASRKSWGARPARPRIPQSDNQIREFFVHHPASPHDLGHIDTDQEQDAYARSIQDFHMDTRGWSDIAYSFLVFQNGRVYRGRGRNYVPAAQLGHNTGTIAVMCVLGDREAPSRQMCDSLIRLKDRMDREVGRDLVARPHSSVTSTDCPGDKLRAFIPSLNKH